MALGKPVAATGLRAKILHVIRRVSRGIDDPANLLYPPAIMKKAELNKQQWQWREALEKSGTPDEKLATIAFFVDGLLARLRCLSWTDANLEAAFAEAVEDARRYKEGGRVNG